MSELLSVLTSSPDVASAVGAIASAVAAILALGVSIIALYISRSTLSHQRTHNKLSLKPMPFISLGDYSNKIVVILKNHGSGPLVVKNLSVHSDGKKESSILAFMPELPNRVLWTTFVVSVKDRAVLPGDSITLLALSGNDDDITFTKARDSVRFALAPLSISVEYTDVYDTKFSDYSRPLDWFGRHCSEDSRPCDQTLLEKKNAHNRAP